MKCLRIARKPGAVWSVGLCLVLCGCRAQKSDRPMRVLDRFGPVLGNELIVGRAETGPTGPSSVTILAGGEALVEIDLAARRVTRRLLQEAGGSSVCWGLARLANGGLWTLRGRNTLLELTAQAAIVRQVTLTAAHVGLYAAGDRLVYQRLDFAPPNDALASGPPGEQNRERWGDMRTRPFGLARASVAALNLVACGGSLAAERPCWFPDETALSMIDLDGHTRRLELPRLVRVAPEILLTAQNPARPIRDAYVDSGGVIWVIGSGTAGRHAPAVPGGTLLARYDAAGQILTLARLAEPARLILRAEPGRAFLLSGDGYVIEVAP